MIVEDDNSITPPRLRSGKTQAAVLRRPYSATNQLEGIEMNINDLTIGQARDLVELFGNKSAATPTPFPVGCNVIVRTVTMIFTGKLVSVHPDTLELVDCSWIPETERYMQFVSEGKVKECEPYPDGLSVFINRGALIDMCELRKDLPRNQK